MRLHKFKSGATLPIMNFPNLHKQATIRRARQAIRSPSLSPIKTQDYFFEDFYSDEELDGDMQQSTSEPAGQPLAETLPPQRPTTGGKTVNDDYYKTLERQAEQYEKQEASEDEKKKKSTAAIPLDRLFDDDELDADITSSDPVAMTTSSPPAEDGDITPISTPDYFFDDEDATPPSSPPIKQTIISTKATESDAPLSSPIIPFPDYVEPSIEAYSDWYQCPPRPGETEDSSKPEIEENFDWYQHPRRPGETEGRWTPEYAHARRAPRIKGKIVTIWVERSKTFFSFPPEVRQRIYKYALFPKGIEGHGPRPYFSHSSTWKVRMPALLRTAFDVRREAIPYYYSEVKMACSDPVFAKMWLSKIGKEARMALGGVTVRFDVEDKKNTTEEQQRLRFFQDFRAAGVEVRKEIIQVR